MRFLFSLVIALTWLSVLQHQAHATPQSAKNCQDCPEMVVIPAGSFEMGLNGQNADEKPLRRVTLKSFAMSRTEVTQGQWKAIMGGHHGGYTDGRVVNGRFTHCGDQCPVDTVSWDDAQRFIQKLNTKTGKQYRLPSEAEWEYACRAGGKHEYCGSDNIDSVAWHSNNSDDTAHIVASKQANAFDLFDMSGNLWELVEDSYHENYTEAPTDGSVWHGNAEKRVLRGGNWKFGPLQARSTGRSWTNPSTRIKYVGFRLARTLTWWDLVIESVR